MARFNVANADNYGGQGGGGYFSLKEDKETAQVRFLYDTVDDIEGFAVHEIPDKNSNSPYAKKSVNCLREYGAPVDDCPFCKAGKPVKVKYFVPIWNIKENRMQTWERGKKFGGRLSSMCSRYPHLYTHIFEIERQGASGSTETQYEIWETGQTDVKLEDFGEIQNPLGSHVLDKSAEDMQYYLDRGSFMDDEDTATPSRDEQQYIRRTPANTNRREVF